MFIGNYLKDEIMSRAWKEISKKVVQSHPDVGGQVMLSIPDFSFDDLPDWADAFTHESPQLIVEGDKITPRQVRTFLWEHRSSRAVQRDRAFVWSKYDEENNSSVVGIGTLTVKEATERLNNGYS